VYYKRGTRGAKNYVINLWPRYQPDQDEPEIYENYCYAKLLLHHPFTNDPDSLLGNHLDWTAAYQSDCLDQHHNHTQDSLPDYVQEDNEDDNSDSESILDEDREAENWRAEWMQEAGRRPNQSVEMDFANLGARDMDLAYDWIEHSSDQAQIDAATKWLTDTIKESPNDDAQNLSHVEYNKLKGQQHNVFLQVMAYFKKIHAGGPNKPDPICINIDGTAGTGKSFLIWCITHALKELFEDELEGHDPVVRLAPTGVAAFGIHG
jgi:ATP-dependent DNA helicase PIF1